MANLLCPAWQFHQWLLFWTNWTNWIIITDLLSVVVFCHSRAKHLTATIPPSLTPSLFIVKLNHHPSSVYTVRVVQELPSLLRAGDRGPPLTTEPSHAHHRSVRAAQASTDKQRTFVRYLGTALTTTRNRFFKPVFGVWVVVCNHGTTIAEMSASLSWSRGFSIW